MGDLQQYSRLLLKCEEMADFTQTITVITAGCFRLRLPSGPILMTEKRHYLYKSEGEEKQKKRWMYQRNKGLQGGMFPSVLGLKKCGTEPPATPSSVFQFDTHQTWVSLISPSPSPASVMQLVQSAAKGRASRIILQARSGAAHTSSHHWEKV